MRYSTQQRIVVGVSGSAASLTALRWAADEARLRGADLNVVRAWDPARHAAPYAVSGHLPTCDEDHAAARDGLAAAMRGAFGSGAPDRVTPELAEGVPERVLVGRSADADLLVLGVTSQAWLAGRSAGPVVRACLAHASCPVVLVGAANSGHAADRREHADALA
jgi:nucleotide-binding universal stress UspA family protein